MSKSRTIGWVLVIAAVGAAGYFGWQKHTNDLQAAEAAQKRSAQRPAVPVKIAPVEKADFPVYRPAASAFRCICLITSLGAVKTRP